MPHSGHSAPHGVEFSRLWPCWLIMLCLKKTPHRLRDNVLWRVRRPTYALCISSPRLPALQQAR